MAGVEKAVTRGDLKSKESEFIAIRNRLKEAIRSRMRKEYSGSPALSRSEPSQVPQKEFGSFFGPSEPCIARRLLEKCDSIARLSGVAAMSRTTPATLQTDPKIKAQMLRDSRDYSFLNSDDHQQLPAAPLPKQPLLQKTSVAISGTGPSYLSKRPKATSSGPEDRARPETKTCKPVESGAVGKGLPTKKNDGKRQSFLRSFSGNRAAHEPNVLVCGTKRKLEQEMDRPQSKKTRPKSQKSQPSQYQTPQKVEPLRKQLTGKHKRIKQRPLQNRKIEHAGSDGDVNDPESELDFFLQKLSRSERRGPQGKTGDAYDDDVDCMVSSFFDIQKEERISSKIAEKEDEIERLLIQQEMKEEGLKRKSKGIRGKQSCQ